MTKGAPIGQTVALDELAIFFRTTSRAMQSMVRRHGIQPLRRAGRVKLYGPDQVQRIFLAIESEPKIPVG